MPPQRPSYAGDLPSVAAWLLTDPVLTTVTAAGLSRLTKP
jgi:hypothetical protein